MSGGVFDIMLVDDEPAVLKVLTRVLVRAGHTVTACSGIDEAQAHLEKGAKPHLLVTDVALKGSTGKRVARLAQSASPKTRVIFISGYDNLAVGGGHPVLQKPFTPSEFIELVDRVLSAPTSSSALKQEVDFAKRRS